jgi:hypothetical protein
MVVGLAYAILNSSVQVVWLLLRMRTEERVLGGLQWQLRYQ